MSVIYVCLLCMNQFELQNYFVLRSHYLLKCKNFIIDSLL